MVVFFVFINVLYEINMVVVVRKVYSVVIAFKFGCLLLYIKLSYEVRGGLKKICRFKLKIGFFIFLNYLIYKVKIVGF